MDSGAESEGVWIEKVWTFVQLDRYDEALKEAAHGLALHPDSYYLHHWMAVSHYNLEDIEEADRSNQQAIRLDPENGDGYFLRSLILHKQLHFTGELEMAKAAVRLDPECVHFLERLTHAQTQSGLMKDARDTVQQLVSLAPDSADAHELMAGICFDLDDWPGAEEHYRAVLAIDPNAGHIHRNLAVALTQQKRDREAIDCLFSAVKLDASNTEIQDRLYAAVSHYLPWPIFRGRYQQALDALPGPIQHFYEDRRRRNGFIGNHAAELMVVFWLFFGVVAVWAFDQFL